MATAGTLLPPPKPGGRPVKYPRREVVNAIRYVLRTGCAWRMLPPRSAPMANHVPLLSHLAAGMGAWSGSMQPCVTKCVLLKAETCLPVRRS